MMHSYLAIQNSSEQLHGVDQPASANTRHTCACKHLVIHIHLSQGKIPTHCTSAHCGHLLLLFATAPVLAISKLYNNQPLCLYDGLTPTEQLLHRNQNLALGDTQAANQAFLLPLVHHLPLQVLLAAVP